MTYLWHISSDGHSIICVYCLPSACFAPKGWGIILTTFWWSYFINCDSPPFTSHAHSQERSHAHSHTRTSNLFLDWGEDGGGGFRLGAISVGGIEDGAQHGSSAGSVRRHLRHWHTSWKTREHASLLLLDTDIPTFRVGHNFYTRHAHMSGGWMWSCVTNPFGKKSIWSLTKPAKRLLLHSLFAFSFWLFQIQVIGS